MINLSFTVDSIFIHILNFDQIWSHKLRTQIKASTSVDLTTASITTTALTTTTATITSIQTTTTSFFPNAKNWNIQV